MSALAQSRNTIIQGSTAAAVDWSTTEDILKFYFDYSRERIFMQVRMSTYMTTRQFFLKKHAAWFAFGHIQQVYGKFGLSKLEISPLMDLILFSSRDLTAQRVL